ncbi:MAG: DUF934 domain-containing protein [Gammaproteobacteria bacterium]
MPLLKNGAIENDPYTDVSAEENLPATGALLVSLDQWQSLKDELTGRNEAFGIILRSDEKPENIADSLDKFSVIALDFPAFGDGRAYSYARLLRDQYGYEGELRAVGDVLLEQLHFMHRVGFNSFQIDSESAVTDWETAAADVSVWYQPTGDGRDSALELRHK